MLLKSLINPPPSHSPHPPWAISSIPTLSIILYMHIPPIFISPAQKAFLNYKSTCPHACWPSLLGELSSLTYTNLNSFDIYQSILI